LVGKAVIQGVCVGASFLLFSKLLAAVYTSSTNATDRYRLPSVSYMKLII